MDLVFKDDWPAAQERMRAWWEHELLDRCALAVFAPRARPLPGPEAPVFPADVHERWLGKPFLARLNDYGMRHTYYGGEAFPIWTAGYPGWDSMACFFGAEITLHPDTGWVDPFIETPLLSDYDWGALRIDPENRWWRTACDMVAFGVEQARGRSVPGMCAFGGGGDTLSAIRGAERLLYDLVDCPEAVRDCELHIMRLWAQVYETFYDLVRDTAEGSTCWFGLWAPGRFYAAQNDFSYMVSPAMYRDVFLPALEYQLSFLEYSVYHVDGIAAFAHVPMLCELPRLQAIQILPGEGKPSPLHYLDVLRTVQAAGKNLHITVAFDEVEEALSLLSSRGLFIQTWAPDEKAARDLIERVAAWTHD